MVADYDGDGEFHERLDGAFKIEVQAANIPKPIKANPDTYATSHGWTLEIGAPGVLGNDDAPDWASVELLDAAGVVVATTVSTADGTYSFASISPGQYRVRFVRPSGYSFTAPNQSPDEATDSDVTDFVSGTTDLFTFGGGTKLDVNAGLIPSP